MSTWSKCFGVGAGVAPVEAFSAKLKIVMAQKESAIRVNVRPYQYQSSMYPPSPKSLALLRLVHFDQLLSTHLDEVVPRLVSDKGGCRIDNASLIYTACPAQNPEAHAH